MTTLVRSALLLTLLADLAGAQSNYPPNLPGARAEVYKSVDGVDLRVWIYEPEGHRASDRRPAIVFFFGGGFRHGAPAQFEHQAKYMASRGMVAMTADYRVSTRHGVKANKCVEDAKAAIRWVRTKANRLGIDPTRIAAGGGSSGGFLAIAAATLPQHDDPKGDYSISSKPNALVLFNPGVILASVPSAPEHLKEAIDGLADRLGASPESMSPYHHITAGLPPAMIFHGKADSTVPYVSVEMFSKKSRKAGNRSDLIGYEAAEHGFFSHGRGDGKAYVDTVRRMDEFFGSLGWLKGRPTIQPSE